MLRSWLRFTFELTKNHFSVEYFFTLMDAYQCCGSGTFWYGAGSCSFRKRPSRCQKKKNFLAFYFLKPHLHYFLKIKLSSRCHKTVEIKARFFLLCLLDDGRRIRIRTNNDGSGSGRSKQHKDRSVTLMRTVQIRYMIIL